MARKANRQTHNHPNTSNEASTAKREEVEVVDDKGVENADKSFSRKSKNTETINGLTVVNN